MYLWTSESVSFGHPDKVADQIADAVLDLVLAKDPTAKVAVEAVVTRKDGEDYVILTGEIGCVEDAWPTEDELHEQINSLLVLIGYSTLRHPFDPGFSCNYKLVNLLRKQSWEIAAAVDQDAEIGAGDQGLMFGFATDEGPNNLPLAHWLADAILWRIEAGLWNFTDSFFHPDAKSQVTLQYDDEGNPKRVDTVVVSACHHPNIDIEIVRKTLRSFIDEIHEGVDIDPDGEYSRLIKSLFDDKTKYIFNPAGAWTLGGPAADTGLSGRKIVVDQYGPYCPIGGGSFSGKDPTKVDRSGAYAARWLAKNIVHSGISGEAQVQLSYAIGFPEPVSLRVKLNRCKESKTAELESAVAEYIMKNVSLTPKSIIDRFSLRTPTIANLYEKTARHGHFSVFHPTRSEPWAENCPPWESLSFSLAKIL